LNLTLKIFPLLYCTELVVDQFVVRKGNRLEIESGDGKGVKRGSSCEQEGRESTAWCVWGAVFIPSACTTQQLQSVRAHCQTHCVDGY
jgi:hypothetical protein